MSATRSSRGLTVRVTAREQVAEGVVLLDLAHPSGARLPDWTPGAHVDLLLPVFGDRLLFPREFAGAGDMKRGGMLLRATREGRELDYVTLDAPRRRSRA